MNDIVTGVEPVAPRPVGSNHARMRQFNERIVLQAIRLHGALPKAEVSRLTRLSMQTASVIINGLLKEGLVIKQERVRGRIGQPSVPIALNPDGAFTLGIKVGRRSLDVLAMDFVGQVRYREVMQYDYPDPHAIFPAIEKRLRSVDAQLGEHADRLVGLGVAAPLWLGGWRDYLGAPAKVMQSWNEIDIRQRIQSMTHLPVEFAKDTTAACSAELLVGQGRRLKNFLYLFIGTFIGGGLVLDGHLFVGPHGNAGAVGSLPMVGRAQRGSARASNVGQLLHQASGLGLEQLFTENNVAAAAAHDARALSATLWPLTAQWLDEACPALALSVTASTALLDLDAVVIDGSFDRELVQHILQRTTTVLDGCDWEGIVRPQLMAGSLGADARAMGAAMLPLYWHFAPNQERFVKAEELQSEV